MKMGIGDCMKNMTRALLVEILPGDSTEKPVWSSDRSDVVEVDRNGTITIVGAGTAIIKAESSSDSNISDTCTIHVLTDEQKKDISANSVVVSNIRNMIFDGSPKKQDDMKLFDNASNHSMVEGIDYSVEYSSNVNAGTVIITITGNGIYTGSRTESFSIIPYDVSKNASRVSEKPRSYNKLNPNLGRLNIEVNGVDTYVDLGMDYDVDYNDAKLPGIHTLKYIFKGNYSGEISYTLTTIVNSTEIKSIKKKGKKLVVTWTRPEYVDGYVVYRATKLNGKYKKVKTLNKAKTLKYTDTKVKKGKKYYYKLKAYVVIDGKTYYSDFSNVKNKKYE